VLAKLGHRVIGYDVDEVKIARLSRGELPFREPGLPELLREQLAAGRIRFTNDAKTAVTESELLMLAVGTPSAPDGSADLRYVDAAVDTIARHLDGPKIVVTKSTVPIGTNRRIRRRFAELVDASRTPVAVVSNPEFLREGSALRDSLHPARTVIGGDDPAAMAKVRSLYDGLDAPCLMCGYETAELIKYASNGFLAAKISYMNEIARLADAVGADVETVAAGMGLDPRIAPMHLKAGIGYGGSCFPKDVDELLAMARRHNLRLRLLTETKRVNDTQIDWFVGKIAAVRPIAGSNALVLGAAFKEDTDDQRESPGIRLIEKLLRLGAGEVRVMDPTVRAAEDLRWRRRPGPRLLARVRVVTEGEDAARGIDFAAVATPWEAFRRLPWRAWAEAAARPLLFDGRNFLDPAEMREAGWTYYGVAREVGG